MRMIICEDQKEHSDLLKEQLNSACLQMEIEAESICFSSGGDLLAYLENASILPDLIFISIVFQADNGIEIARKIYQSNPRIKMIFVTAYVQYAPDIFEVSPVYMLKKPVEYEKLCLALEKAKHIIENERSQLLSFQAKGEIHSVPIADVLYIGSESRKVSIHSREKTMLIYQKLSEVEKVLPIHFVRCHQSYIVNLMHIRKLGKNYLELCSGAKLPVSQRKYNEVKKVLMKNSIDLVNKLSDKE